MPSPSDERDGAYEAFRNKREALLTKLLYEIAKEVGIRVEQLDILEGNYMPQGWHDDEMETAHFT